MVEVRPLWGRRSWESSTSEFSKPLRYASSMMDWHSWGDAKLGMIHSWILLEGFWAFGGSIIYPDIVCEKNRDLLVGECPDWNILGQRRRL